MLKNGFLENLPSKVFQVTMKVKEKNQYTINTQTTMITGTALYNDGQSLHGSILYSITSVYNVVI